LETFLGGIFTAGTSSLEEEVLTFSLARLEFSEGKTFWIFFGGIFTGTTSSEEEELFLS